MAIRHGGEIVQTRACCSCKSDEEKKKKKEKVNKAEVLIPLSLS